MVLQTARLKTPVGNVGVFVADDAVVALEFEDYHDVRMEGLRKRFGSVTLEMKRDPGGVMSRLRAYFKGDIEAIESIPVDTGGTPFQLSVWKELRRIPAGTTTSYAGLARKVGRPRAVRAVGTANGTNPVAVIVPCHRVIGSDGSLTGYGGGLDRKRWLIDHETKHAGRKKR